MLGFGALGEFALGEGPFASATLLQGQSWPTVAAKKISAAIIATSFVGFVAPPAATPSTPFTKFSEPSRPVNSAARVSWISTPFPKATVITAFTQFSQPQPSRINLPDEQPSALFEILPPPRAPFGGFARFTEQIRVKPIPQTDFRGFVFTPTTPDTHDLVFDTFRKKKKRPDPIDDELARKARLRAGLELAAYGPPPEISYESIPEALPVAAPADVAGLAKAILQAQEAQQQAMRARLEADEEDDLEMIMREIG